MNRKKLESFERAFHAGTSGCTRACNCGRVFYDVENSYDWEDGELERLEANPEATALDYSVGDIRIGGVDYVADCDCWHEKASDMMRWIDGNAHQIAQYLTLEKKRKRHEAEVAPVVG